MHHRRRRVVLYSHDTMGLGHMRRNLLIAQTLAGPPPACAVLIVAGTREAAYFAMSAGVDCVALPALYKRADGCYDSRCLDVPVQQLINMRASIIRGAVKAFDPDLLIVDNVPRGALRELEPTLEDLSARGRTRRVLGLRDVLDAPSVVQREWTHAENERAIREYYDDVWVYGDPAVYDLVAEYQLSPDIAARVRYTGYFDQRARLDHARGTDADVAPLLPMPRGRLVVGVVGGGQDGGRVAEAFASAETTPDVISVLVTGPFMPADVQQRLLALAAARPRLRVLGLVAEPGWLVQQADRVIAMGGYNTLSEVLSFRKPALIVPRVSPRREQWIRAERFQRLGLVEVLHPDEASADAIGRWVAGPTRSGPIFAHQINLDGLSTVAQLAEELLAVPWSVPVRRVAVARPRAFFNFRLRTAGASTR